MVVWSLKSLICTNQCLAETSSVYHNLTDVCLYQNHMGQAMSECNQFKVTRKKNTYKYNMCETLEKGELRWLVGIWVCKPFSAGVEVEVGMPARVRDDNLWREDSGMWPLEEPVLWSPHWDGQVTWRFTLIFTSGGNTKCSFPWTVLE